jgi:hypothetical protein
LSRKSGKNLTSTNEKTCDSSVYWYMSSHCMRRTETSDWEMISHAPYSPNLAPSDHHLFSP